MTKAVRRSRACPARRLRTAACRPTPGAQAAGLDRQRRRRNGRSNRGESPSRGSRRRRGISPAERHRLTGASACRGIWRTRCRSWGAGSTGVRRLAGGRLDAVCRAHRDSYKPRDCGVLPRRQRRRGQHPQQEPIAANSWRSSAKVHAALTRTGIIFTRSSRAPAGWPWIAQIKGRNALVRQYCATHPQ